MKQTTLKTRLLAMLLVFAMVIGMVPVQGVAAAEIVNSFYIHSGLAGEDGQIHVNYTPEETGYYFLVNTSEYPSLEACADGETPLSKFDFDDEDGWGCVYELEAGKTYCFTVSDRGGEYFAYVKQVTVPADFTVPEAMTGYVGETLWLDIGFEGAQHTEVTSSDDTVAMFEGGNAHVAGIKLLKAGTATITFTSHTGVVHTCEVTVENPPSIEVGQTINLAMNEGEQVSFQFTPAESGSYQVSTQRQGVFYAFEITTDAERAQWMREDSSGITMIDLVAGETYLIKVLCYMNECESTLTVQKCEKMVDVVLQDELIGYAGDSATVPLEWVPAESMDRLIIWSSSNSDVVMTSGGNYQNTCNVVLVAPGQAELTAMWKDDNGQFQSKTCNVTVLAPTALTLDEERTLYLEEGVSEYFGYTTETDERYVVEIESDGFYSIDWGGNWYEHYYLGCLNSEKHMFRIPAGDMLTMKVYYNGEPAHVSFNIQKAVYASDIVINGGSEITVNLGETLFIPVEPVDGNYIHNVNVESSDYNVVDVQGSYGDGFYIYGNETGTATITVTADNSISKTVDIEVREYGADIPDKWIGEVNGEYVEVEFTPETDGYYHLHYVGIDSFEVAAGSSVPLAEFEGGIYDYRGRVYQLEAGVTYRFRSSSQVYGIYRVLMAVADLAQDFSVPATMTGRVHESHWMALEYSGIMTPVTYEITNENVVMLTGSNNTGIGFYLIAEGTADIIVTDSLGNRHVCTVTVSGEREPQMFDGWTEFALAAGDSITYYYTPGQSGLYWIYNSLGHDVGIELKENGAALGSEYAFSTGEGNRLCGQVYNLTGGTTYELTFTSAETVLTNMVAAFVEGEAHSVGFDYGHDAVVTPGDRWYLSFNLFSDYYPEVANVTVISSNESVIKVEDYNGSGAHLYACNSGSADITVCINGQPAATATISVQECESFGLNETKYVTYDENGSLFQFTPAESGTYLVIAPTENDEMFCSISPRTNHNVWFGEDKHGVSMFNLEAGKSYTFEVYCYNADRTVPVTLVKAEPMTGLTLDAESVVRYEGTVVTISATIVPDLGADRPVTWTSSNEDVASIDGHNMSVCHVFFRTPGNAVITASWVDDNGQTQSVSCDVTVLGPVELTLNEAVPFSTDSNEEARFTFTADTEGWYLAKVIAEEYYSMGAGGGQDIGFASYGDYQLCYCYLSAGETFILTSSAQNATITVENRVDATDLSVNGSDRIDMCVGESLHVKVNPADGNFYGSQLDAEVTGEYIADVHNVRVGEFDVFAYDVGTTTITLTTDTGIIKEVEVTVHEYGYDIPDKWIGEAMNGYATVEFTPAADGYYYFHYEGISGLVVVPGAPEPKLSFEYRDRYDGRVFELEGGVTYRFRSENIFWGEYRIYAVPVEVAKDFTISESLSGMVGENRWLSIECSGILAATFVSTDENVVMVGDCHSGGVNLYLVGEGTAEVIATDPFGNERRCTVTVSGELPAQNFDGWAEIALAAGKSITFNFTPYQSGLYWIYSAWEQKLGIEVKENGNVIDCNYEFNRGYRSGEYGRVYNLTAGTTYELTFSSDTAMRCPVYAEYVSGEAYGVEFYEGANREVLPGEEWYINIGLVSDYYPQVANVRFTSSDTSVLEIVGYDGNGLYVKAVGAGTADVEAWINDERVNRTTMTVLETENFEVGTTKVLNMTWGDAITYSFTPEISGTYVVYVDARDYYPVEIRGYDNFSSWQQNDKYGIVLYDLVAGETYAFGVVSQTEDTVSVTLTKAEPMTDLTIDPTCTAFVGFGTSIHMTRTPDLGFEGNVAWTSSDSSIVEITGFSADRCFIHGNAAGQAVISASWVDEYGVTQTRECVVTVKVAETLQLNQETSVKIPEGETGAYCYTAGGSGVYMIKIAHGGGYRLSFNGNFNDNGYFETTEYIGHLFYIYPGEQVMLTFTAAYGDVDTTVTVEQAVHASDIVINGGNPIELIQGNEAWIDIELVDGNYIDGPYMDISDYSVADLMDVRGDGFRIYAREAGTATITINSGNSIAKTVELTVKEYGEDIPDKWIGEAYGEHLLVEFTPSVSGYYFFHGNDYFGLLAAEGSPAPLACYDHASNTHIGQVFKLEANVTYRFRSEYAVFGEYKLFAVEVEMAKDFSVPAALSGMVNERYWLEPEYEGTLIPTYRSTNENVVVIGNHGSMGAALHLVGEGTADIIVTDIFGNEHRCTVTVSGQSPVQDFMEWMEIGLAAGKSVTYRFPSGEEGLYWVLTGQNARFDIEVTLDGVPVAYEYAFGRYEQHGYVYRLAADTVYELTFTNNADTSVATWGDAMYVWEEATTINPYFSNSLSMDAGKQMSVYYELMGSYDLAVGNLQIVSSNESVVQVVSCNGSEAVLKAVGTGTAELKAILNGNEFYLATVTVRVVEPMELDVPYVVNINYDDYVKFSFTPKEDGNYIVYQPAGRLNYQVYVYTENGEVDSSYLQDEQIEGVVVYDLKAGETYYVRFDAYDLGNVDRTVTITKSLDTTGVSLSEDELDLYVDQHGVLFAHFQPQFGANSRLVWTVDNPEVVEILYQIPTGVEFVGLKSGTAVVTATAVDDPSITASCTITVKEILNIELGVETEFTFKGDEVIYYYFTPETEGQYVLSMPADAGIGFDLVDPVTDSFLSSEYWATEEYDSRCFTLEAGKTYLVRLCRYTVAGELVGKQATSTVIVNKLAETTGSSLMITSNEVYVGRYVNIELAPNPYYACPPTVEEVTVSDETVLAVSYVDGRYVTLDALKVGECTVTVRTSLGETLTATIKVIPIPQLTDGVVEEKDIAYNESGLWSFVADHDGEYTIEVSVNNSTPFEVFIPEPAPGSDGFYHYEEFAGGGYSVITLDMKAGEVAQIWIYSFEGDMHITLLAQHVHVLEHVDATEGTCAEPGMKEHYECQYCDKLFADQDGKTEVTAEDLAVEAEHSYTEKIVDPTCIAKGYTTHTCSVCGDAYVDSFVDALGHDMGEWVVTKEPTATAEGEKTRTCQRSGCDAKETEVIPVLQVPEITKLESTTSGIKLSWDAYYGAGQYRVYVKSGTGWKRLGETTDTSYVYTAAEAGVKYTFTVRAMNAEGTGFVSSYNNTGWSHTYYPVPEITALKSTGEGIQITWGAINGAAKYRVYIKNGTAWTKLVEVADTSYVYTAAQAGEEYTFTIRVLNDAGTSISSYNNTGWSHTYYPTPVITVLESTAEGIQITWDTVNGASKYAVYVKDGETWTKLDEVADTGYLYADAKAGVSYTFSVQALNAEGTPVSDLNETGWSHKYYPTPEITNMISTTEGIQITWGAINGASKYRVYIKSGSSWKKLDEVTGTSYLYTGAEAGVSYTFTIRVLNEAGTSISAYNNTGWSHKYYPTPEIIGLTSTTEGIRITWGAINGAAKYRVYIKSGSSWKKLDEVAGTSYLYTGAEAGETYTFTIRVLNDAGTSISAYNNTGWSHRYYPTPEITGFTSTTEGIQITWGAINGAAKYRVYVMDRGTWLKLDEVTGTSYVYTAAEAGVSYTFAVQALNAEGTPASYFNVTGWDYTYYPTPVITALENTDFGIQLTWGAINGASKYAVYAKDGDTWIKLDEVADTSYVYTAVEAGVSYTFSVQALNAEGTPVSGFNETGWSHTYNLTFAITALESTTSGIQLTWSEVDGASKYAVYVKDGKTWTKLDEVADTTYLYADAKAGVSYTFSVQALNAEGTPVIGFNNTGWSHKYYPTPEITGLTSTTEGIQITWGAINGAAKYRVYIKSGSSWKKLDEVTGTSYLYTGAEAGVSYTFTIRVLNEAGTSISSYNNTGWSHKYYPTPEITGLTSTTEGIQITWGAINGAAKYRVYIKSGSSWKKLDEVTGTSYLYTGAEAGVSYTFTIRVLNEAGTSISSYNNTGWSHKYYPTPEITSLVNTAEGIQISWGAINGAVKYRVYIKSGSSWKRLDETAETGYLYTGVQAGETYTFTIRALNEAGTSISSYSNTGWSITFE